MGRQKNSEQLTCAQCQQQFFTSKYEVNKGRKYCSKKCVGISQAKPLTVICENCGIEFTKMAGRTCQKSKHHFCTRGCRGEWMKGKTGATHPLYKSIEVQCNACGATFMREPRHATTYEHNYCNRDCAMIGQSKERSGPNHPRWKGGYRPGYRGPNWNTQSETARCRDGYKCQHCGITQKRNRRKLDVHHIVPFRSFNYIPGINDNYLQANTLSNLLTLCTGCHKHAEVQKIPIQPVLL